LASIKSLKSFQQLYIIATILSSAEFVQPSSHFYIIITSYYTSIITSTLYYH